MGTREFPDAPRLFLPGWGYGVEPIAPMLARAGWTARPLPGMTPGEEIPASFPQAVDTLLRTLPPKCYLGGWSLGGILALACAAARPERILGLSLVATTPSFIQREGWAHGRPREELDTFMATIRESGSETLPAFAERFCRGDEYQGAAALFSGAARERESLEASSRHKAALLAGLDWLAEADARAETARITAPVTLWHGDRDRLIPPEASRWLARHLPNAASVRLVILPGRAHAPFAGNEALLLQ
ncbi:MAG: alpha/beta hydrolase [Zoogloeaceae bacterium]|jgi:pimeloyl-[acyl-carrier protein] methyl ester esterase|nr:alpha/beta hydrolase [Zoogloeaceae bacterium]